jgi:hypothetical protein
MGGCINKTMMKPGIIYIVLGIVLEWININSLLTIPFDKSKGVDYLIGEILFNIVVGMAGIALIIIGIVKPQRDKKRKY